MRIASRGGGDIVGAYDARAHAHGQRREAEAAVQPLIGARPKYPADEALARHAHQQRRAQGRDAAADASSSARLCSQALAEPEPRIERDGLARRCPPRCMPPAARAGTRTPRSPRPGSAGWPAWYAAPPACASGTRRRRRRGPWRAPGARSAYTSLTMQAPAATAAAMTSGLLVSMEIATRVAAAMRSMTGTTRGDLDAASTTAEAPGRVDSPPTSMMAAPSAAIAAARSSAASRLAVAAAVGEGIGRHVQDAHDDRSRRGR